MGGGGNGQAEGWQRSMLFGQRYCFQLKADNGESSHATKSTISFHSKRCDEANLFYFVRSIGWTCLVYASHVDATVNIQISITINLLKQSISLCLPF